LASSSCCWEWLPSWEPSGSSCSKWDGVGNPIYVGLENYALVLADPVFIQGPGVNHLILVGMALSSAFGLETIAFTPAAAFRKVAINA
jgi:hypothetical protein